MVMMVIIIIPTGWWWIIIPNMLAQPRGLEYMVIRSQVGATCNIHPKYKNTICFLSYQALIPFLVLCTIHSLLACISSSLVQSPFSPIPFFSKYFGAYSSTIGCCFIGWIRKLSWSFMDRVSQSIHSVPMYKLWGCRTMKSERPLQNIMLPSPWYGYCLVWGINFNVHILPEKIRIGITPFYEITTEKNLAFMVLITCFGSTYSLSFIT